jgi:hypothetical protein
LCAPSKSRTTIIHQRLPEYNLGTQNILDVHDHDTYLLFSLWPAGIASSAPGTVQWAGGNTIFFSMIPS